MKISQQEPVQEESTLKQEKEVDISSASVEDEKISEVDLTKQKEAIYNKEMAQQLDANGRCSEDSKSEQVFNFCYRNY